MTKILYYLFLKPLSYLPLPVLYVISDIAFFILYHVVKYRRGVVHQNLVRSFPSFTRSDITVLERKFYSHFCDLIVESIKMFSITKEAAVARVTMVNPELLDKYYNQGKSVIIVAGHYNSWEMGGAVFGHYVKHKTMGIYAPLSNKFFDEKFKITRGKFGLEMESTKKVSQWFKDNSETPTCILFGADQSPTHSKTVYWTNFLNQETAVMIGTERFAKEYNYPVVYVYVSKQKRGYYQMELKLLEENPAATAFGEISEKHTRWLEKQIIDQPQYWLWTHKRWKRKRKEGELVDGSMKI